MTYTPRPGSVVARSIQHLVENGGYLTPADIVRLFATQVTGIATALAPAIRAGLLAQTGHGSGKVRYALPPGAPRTPPVTAPANLSRAPGCAAVVIDLTPPPVRPGANQPQGLPSRIGDRLHYRDGRITTLAGEELQAALGTTTYRPTHDGFRVRAPRVFPRN